MKESKFMDIPQLVGYIHFSKSSIYKMIGKNCIPYHKVQGRLLFEQDEIDLWVLNNGRIIDLPHLPKLNN